MQPLAQARQAIRHWLVICATVALMLPGIAGAQSSASSATVRKLDFLTWSEYIDPAVVAEFERRFNAEVTYTYFESDDHRDEILAANAGRGFDVILVNGLQIEQYGRRDWLVPITGAAVPNRRHIAPRWAEAFPGARTYGVPYFWGNIGIAYRKDRVPEGFTSWRELLQPAERLRGKIIMNRSARELVAFALKATGHSANTADPRLLAQAEQMLIEQKPYVQSYGYIALSAESSLVRGDVWATTLYNGDVLVVGEHQPDIAYAMPKEGSLLWVDYLAVAQASDQKDLALAFINFLNEPEIAARLAEFVHYATPNRAAERYLPEAFLANPIIYPPPEQLARSEFFHELPPPARRKINSIGVRLFYQ